MRNRVSLEVFTSENGLGKKPGFFSPRRANKPDRASYFSSLQNVIMGKALSSSLTTICAIGLLGAILCNRVKIS